MSNFITISEPKTKTFQEQRILLYSDSAGGKTTLCAGLEDAVYVDLEATMDFFPGHRTISVDSTDPVAGVNHLAGAMEEIVASAVAKNTKTVVLDALPQLHNLSTAAAKAQLGVKDLGEIPHGKGWLVARQHMLDVLEPMFGLSSRGIGCIIITFAETVTLEKPTGDVERITPVLPEKATRHLINSRTDMMLYLQTGVDGKRYLYSEDNGTVHAKDRTKLMPEVLHIENAPRSMSSNECAKHMFAQVKAAYEGAG